MFVEKFLVDFSEGSTEHVVMGHVNRLHPILYSYHE
jgi:hypothetical protein